jgi:hypothetical protein
MCRVVPTVRCPNCAEIAWHRRGRMIAGHAQMRRIAVASLLVAACTAGMDRMDRTEVSWDCGVALAGSHDDIGSPRLESNVELFSNDAAISGMRGTATFEDEAAVRRTCEERSVRQEFSIDVREPPQPIGSRREDRRQSVQPRIARPSVLEEKQSELLQGRHANLRRASESRSKTTAWLDGRWAGLP